LHIFDFSEDAFRQRGKWYAMRTVRLRSGRRDFPCRPIVEFVVPGARNFPAALPGHQKKLERHAAHRRHCKFGIVEPLPQRLDFLDSQDPLAGFFR
jgi:hypothetical protein